MRPVEPFIYSMLRKFQHATRRWKDTISKGLFLFSPEKSDVSLLMEDVLLEVGEGSPAIVVIQNHGTEAVCLPEGCYLGSITPIEEVQPTTDEQTEKSDIVAVLSKGNTTTSDRTQLLLEQLDLELPDLAPPQREEL